jgi:hypothetical protein
MQTSFYQQLATRGELTAEVTSSKLIGGVGKALK